MTRERRAGPAWGERLTRRDGHPLACALPSDGAIEPEESAENAATKRRLALTAGPNGGRS